MCNFKIYVELFTALLYVCSICSFTLTSQKRKFSIKDFFSKRNQILWKMCIWSHLLKKSIRENFISFAVILFDKVLSKCAPEIVKHIFSLRIFDFYSKIFDVFVLQNYFKGRKIDLAMKI